MTRSCKRPTACAQQFILQRLERKNSGVTCDDEVGALQLLSHLLDRNLVEFLCVCYCSLGLLVPVGPVILKHDMTSYHHATTLVYSRIKYVQFVLYLKLITCRLTVVRSVRMFVRIYL